MSIPSNPENFIANLAIIVYKIHDEILGETGGLIGIRDFSTLHSAVARPFVMFAGQELYPTDFEKAAALFHSLIKNHPFMDGTKRTAFASAIYFLKNRGYQLADSVDEDEIIEFCIAVAEENSRVAAGEAVIHKSIYEIAEWFQKLVS